MGQVHNSRCTITHSDVVVTCSLSVQDSWRRNATSDMLAPTAAARWTSTFLGRHLDLQDPDP